MNDTNVLTRSQPKVEMTMRIRRADGSWEDGPKVHSVMSFGFIQNLKLNVLLKMSKFLEKTLQKLEGMK